MRQILSDKVAKIGALTAVKGDWRSGESVSLPLMRPGFDFGAVPYVS